MFLIGFEIKGVRDEGASNFWKFTYTFCAID